MIVLGFIGGFKRAEEDDVWGGYRHDSSAALMRDGEVVAAIEEERLNRLKHTNCFPARAIQFCLSRIQATWDDIDFIVTGAEAAGLTSVGQTGALLDVNLPMPKDAVEFTASLFQRDFGFDPGPKLRFYDHHLAHIWSAYSFSGFDEALILSIDGAGDGRSGSVYIGNGNTLTRLREYSVAQSLGHFYLRTIRLMGFSNFDEYKAMGLAPYGNSATFKKLFDAGYSLLPDGNYRLDSESSWIDRLSGAGLFAHARRKGEPFRQVHMDLAAALQAALEEIAIHVVKHYHHMTGIRNICLAGGVAHNCTLNGKILKLGLFDKMFVQPAAHDGGLSLGACCAAFSQEAPAIRVKPMRDVFFGAEGRDECIVEEIRRWGNFVEVVGRDDSFTRTAELLAEGAVIGRLDGRSEFGPRALGNRSILADPRPASNKDLINSMVKKREQFRPFAPAVVKERAHEFFDVPDCDADLSFMTYTINVQPAWRDQLGAITHVDGTARVQIVDRHSNPTFWKLLQEFGRLTKIPVLLNTSFNNNAEPIVNSVEDAIVCYLTTGLDYLLIGPYLVRKRAAASSFEAFATLVPEVPDTRRLVAQRGPCGLKYSIESVKANLDRRPRSEISPELYVLLGQDGKDKSLGALLDIFDINDQGRRLSIKDELAQLWSARLIRLSPSNNTAA